MELGGPSAVDEEGAYTFTADVRHPIVTGLSSRQAETYQNHPNRPTHGYSGPLKVSYGGAPTNVGLDYVATVGKYDKTRVVVDDANRMVDDVNRHEVWPLSPNTPPLINVERPTGNFFPMAFTHSSGRSGSTGRRDADPISRTITCTRPWRRRRTSISLRAISSNGSSSSASCLF